MSGGRRTTRVADRLRLAIADGRLVPGERLPPETELAEELDVSRGTLREAMRGLVEEGYLHRRPGAGTFVTQRPVMRNTLERNFGVTRLIEAFGLEAGTIDQEFAVEPADEDTAEALELRPGDPVHVLRRVRTAEDVPVVYSIDHWAPEPARDAPPDGGFSVYQAMRERGMEVHHGVAKLRPVSADADLARRLRTARGALLLEIWQVDFTELERPVLASREYHLADAFEISVYRRGPDSWEL